MLTSLAIIVILGLLFNFIFTKLRLPGLLGMIIAGILIGPNFLNMISPKLLSISDELRKIALVIILLRASLSVSKKSVNNSFNLSIKMGIIPSLFEATAVFFLAVYLLKFGYLEALLLGFVIASVSPAIVASFMIDLLNKSDKQKVPTILIAGSTIDNIFCITLFSFFLSIYYSTSSLIIKIIGLPLSILLGAMLGFLIGFVLYIIFKKYSVRDTKKAIILIFISILFLSLESYYKNISALIGIIVIGFVLTEKLPEKSKKIALKLNKIWIFAEIILFVLVGSMVNIKIALNIGIVGLFIIIIGLLFRSIGVYISLYKSGLNKAEKLFCIISYIPKATVQAAIGSIPLSMSIANGDIILALSILSIVITAPIGATLIYSNYDKLLGFNTVQKSATK